MIKISPLFAALALAFATAGCASDDVDEATETTVAAVSEEAADGATAGEGDAAEGEMTEDDAAEDDTADGQASTDSLPVTGELTYDGVAIEAGSTLVLTLTDLTDASPDTALKATETIALDDAVSSPIPFELTIPREGLDRNLRYSLRAIINDEAGVAILTTNSANFIDVEAEISDLGSLELVSAG